MNPSAEETGLRKPAVLPEGHEVPGGYLILEQGVFKGDDGSRLIASAPFYVKGRLKNLERGETHYIIELNNDGEIETLLVKTTGGVKAIAKAVEGDGVFLRGREVEEYLTEYIAINWRNMLVTEKAEEIEVDTEVEPVFDQLLQYILENEERFEDHEWGCFSVDHKTVSIRITVMEEFLGSIGIVNKRSTLSFWKRKGVLITDPDGRHLARSVRINGQIRRAYVISAPFNRSKEKENGEVSDGLRDGDKAELININTGETLGIHLLENPKVKNAGSSEISTKSPMGKALLGKKSGDVVKVEVDGKTEGVYKVVNS